MNINPGRMRHKITLQTPPNDVTFGDNGHWSDFATIWAEIKPISGKELMAAETIGSEISHKINIRYKSGIKPNMRVKFGVRYFNIISVINFNELNTLMQLVCKELVQ